MRQPFTVPRAFLRKFAACVVQLVFVWSLQFLFKVCLGISVSESGRVFLLFFVSSKHSDGRH